MNDISVSKGSRPDLVACLVCLLLLTLLPLHSANAQRSGPSVENLLEHYEQIRLALLVDRLEPIAEHARRLEAELRALESDPSAAALAVATERIDEVTRLFPQMRTAVRSLAEADSLASAREAFYRLSQPLVQWFHHAELRAANQVVYCPMKKRSWVQPRGAIGNPYGGEEMPTCGNAISD